jgi:hypothetical protein
VAHTARASRGRPRAYLGGEQTGGESEVRTVETRSRCRSNAPFASHSRLCGAARCSALFICGPGAAPRRVDWLLAAGSPSPSADARRGPAAIGRSASLAPPAGAREPARKKEKGPGEGRGRDGGSLAARGGTRPGLGWPGRGAFATRLPVLPLPPRETQNRRTRFCPLL